MQYKRLLLPSNQDVAGSNPVPRSKPHTHATHTNESRARRPAVCGARVPAAQVAPTGFLAPLQVHLTQVRRGDEYGLR